MKKCLIYILIFMPMLIQAQAGQYSAFTNVYQGHDTLFFEYEWFDLDPVIQLEVFLSFEGEGFVPVCGQAHSVSTGTSNCFVPGLLEGWHEYYLFLEDGDQLIDSTSVGNIFLERSVNLSLVEIEEIYSLRNVRVFDLLGRECDVGKLQTSVVYVFVFGSREVRKIVFLE